MARLGDPTRASRVREINGSCVRCAYNTPHGRDRELSRRSAAAELNSKPAALGFTVNDPNVTQFQGAATLSGACQPLRRDVV